jgi:hypothetical protein
LNPTYNHIARGKGKLGKLKGVIRVIERGSKRFRENTQKNTFGLGLNRFEQGKDSKRFEN